MLEIDIPTSYTHLSGRLAQKNKKIKIVQHLQHAWVVRPPPMHDLINGPDHATKSLQFDGCGQWSPNQVVSNSTVAQRLGGTDR
jgi:hypothetical protein